VAGLNRALSKAVNTANAVQGPHPVFHFVTGISSRFHTHGYCTGVGSPAPWALFNPRYVATPIDSLTSQGDVKGAMHPNELGTAAIGEALVDELRFLARSLSLSHTPVTPRVGTPTPMTVTVRGIDGTPLPSAPVSVDGVSVGSTDQSGRVTFTRTFTTAGSHTITIDHDPFPVATAPFDVLGNHYTISADPTPIPTDRPLTLTLRAADADGAPVAGDVVLTSGTGTTTMRSGASATLTLSRRYEYYWEEGPTGKPVRQRRVICPEIAFKPDSGSFDPSDASGLVACSS
jgi:hypothetical protein